MKINHILVGIVISLMLGPFNAFAIIDANKSFSPAVVAPTEVTTLSITLQNSSLTPSTSVAFTDVFPNDIFVAATPNVTNTCGGTVTPSNNATNGQLDFSGGTIPAGDGSNNGTCTITVDVTVATTGSFTNIIAAGDVTAVNGGVPESNPTQTEGTLAANLLPITGSIDLVFAGTTTSTTGLQGGETGTVTITLDNTNSVDLTGVAFFDTFLNTDGNDARYIRALDGTQSNTCGGALTINAITNTLNANWGDTSEIDFSGGTIPANSSCSISFDVELTYDITQTLTGPNAVIGFLAGDITSTLGAQNNELISRTIEIDAGSRLNRKSLNNATNSELNLAEENTATLRLEFRTRNTTPVPINFTDVMPVLTPGPGAMTVVNITSNTCGGTITINGGTEITLTGGSIQALAGRSGRQEDICNVLATVQVDEIGTYTNTLTIDPANNSGYSLGTRSATLNAVSNVLEVSKRFAPNRFASGEDTRLTITINNFSTVAEVTNLDLTDDLNTMCDTVAACDESFQVLPGSTPTTTCQDGVVTTSMGTNYETIIQLEGATIPPESSCTVSIDIESSHALTPARYVNRIPVGNITFDTATNPGQVYALEVTSNVITDRNLRFLSKTMIPDAVAPGGTSTVRIVVRWDNRHDDTLEQVAFTDTLPTGFVVANPPNFNVTASSGDNCSATLNSSPGDSIIDISDGTISGSFIMDCIFTVDVVAPALTPPNTIESFTNTVFGPEDLSGVVQGVTAGYEIPQGYDRRIDTISVQATQITVNKEFLQTNVNAGAPSRVRISFINTEASSINLSEVALTDDLSSSNLGLHLVVNPSFTDTSGNPDSNGCRGGTFTGNPGDTSITLSDAQIDANTTCYFEFNVSTAIGGNQLNQIDVGDVTTKEGVTNVNSSSATLTVGRNINLAKGFSPNVIGQGGTSTLTIQVINGNQAPNDQTGSSPAFSDTLPAGLTVTGVPTTTCAGGTVSVSEVGGQDVITLSGGTFIAESICEVIATVTSDTPGSYVNTIDAGALSTAEGSTNPDQTTDTLFVLEPLTIEKSFSPASLQTSNDFEPTTLVTFTLTNPNPATLLPNGFTGVSFTDTLVNMQLPTFFTQAFGSCQNIVSSGSPGGNLVTIISADVPPETTCDISFRVTSDVVGSHDNQSSTVTVNEVPTIYGPSNVATLDVFDQPLTFEKTFADSTIALGESTRLTFTIGNPNASAVTLPLLDNFSLAFFDQFPPDSETGNFLMAPADPLNLTNTCTDVTVENADRFFVGTPSLLMPGDAFAVVGDGSIPPGSCEISFDVTTNGVGTFLNSVGRLDYNGGFIRGPFEATLIVTDIAPVAIDDSGGTIVLTPVAIDVVNNDNDDDGNIDASTVDLDTATPGQQTSITTGEGEWIVDSSGLVTFTPAAGFTGQAVISYTVSDANGNVSNVANIQIDVTTEPPFANPNEAETPPGTEVTVNVVEDDTDPDGDIDPTSVDLDPSTPGRDSEVTVPGQGTFSVDDEGVVTFTPEAGFEGRAEINYTVSDNFGNVSNISTITINVAVVTTPVFFIWNGFLDQLNLAVLANRSDTDSMQARVNLLDIDGNLLSFKDFSILPKGERDVLLNEFDGFGADSYGLVKIEFSPVGTLDGHSSIYRFSPFSPDVEHALLKEYESSITGKSYGFKNTLQPSQNLQELEDSVIHWLQLSNHTDSVQGYTVNRYDAVGNLFDSYRVVVPAQGRRDRQVGHEDYLIGRSQEIGLIEVIPDDLTAKYSGEVFRYGSDQVSGVFPTSYKFAQSDNLLTGISMNSGVFVSMGSDGLSYLEVMNVSDVGNSITIDVYSNSGVNTYSKTLSLGARSQLHLPVSEMLAAGESGIAFVSSNTGANYIARNSTYFFNSERSVTTSYSNTMVEPLSTKGIALRNTFLDQFNYLKLFNSSASAVGVDLEVYDFDGNLVNGMTVSLAANQGKDVDLLAELALAPQLYGQIRVKPLVSGAVYSNLLRVRYSADYSYIDLAKQLFVR